MQLMQTNSLSSWQNASICFSWIRQTASTPSTNSRLIIFSSSLVSAIGIGCGTGEEGESLVFSSINCALAETIAIPSSLPALNIKFSSRVSWASTSCLLSSLLVLFLHSVHNILFLACGRLSFLHSFQSLQNYYKILYYQRSLFLNN